MIFRDAVHRDIPRVIARRTLGLVAVLLLLVHNHQPELLKRREHRAAGADDDLRESLFDALVFIEPLPERERAVKDRDAVAEPLCEQRHELRGERYFGHHHDDAPAVVHDALDQLHEHARLARAGHAVEQADLGLRVAVIRKKIVTRRLLLVREHKRRNILVRVTAVDAENLLVKEVDHALLHQRVEHRGTHAREVADLLCRDRSRDLEKLHHALLLRRELLRGYVAVRREGSHLCDSVVDPAERLLGFVEKAVARHFVEHGAVGKSEVIKDLFQSDGLALLKKIVIDPLLFLVEQHRAVLRLDAVDRRDLVVDARGQHGLDRVVERAEAALLHEPRGVEQFGRQNRLAVQHREKRLELFVRLDWMQRRDDALTAAVAPAERHENALACRDLLPQTRGNEIVKLAVKRIGGMLHRNLRGENLAHMVLKLVLVRLNEVDFVVLDFVDRQQNGLILSDGALVLKLLGDFSGSLGHADDQRILALLAFK